MGINQLFRLGHFSIAMWKLPEGNHSEVENEYRVYIYIHAICQVNPGPLRGCFASKKRNGYRESMPHTENEHMNHDSTNQWTNESMNQWISESRNQWIVVLPDTLARFWVVYNPRFYLVFWDLPTTWKLKLDASWGGKSKLTAIELMSNLYITYQEKTQTNKQASKERKKERNKQTWSLKHIFEITYVLIYTSHIQTYIYIYTCLNMILDL